MTLAERLSDVASASAHSCVPVAKRMQQHSEPLASLSPWYPRKLASVPCALHIML
jgi:hypothetical protein